MSEINSSINKPKGPSSPYLEQIAKGGNREVLTRGGKVPQ